MLNKIYPRKCGLLPQIYIDNMEYILNIKDLESFLVQYIFSLYLGLNWGPSDPEADDISTEGA